VAQVVVCSEINKNPSIPCGQNIQFLNAKRAGAFRNWWAIRGQTAC